MDFGISICFLCVCLILLQASDSFIVRSRRFTSNLKMSSKVVEQTEQGNALNSEITALQNQLRKLLQAQSLSSLDLQTPSAPCWWSDISDWVNSAGKQSIQLQKDHVPEWPGAGLSHESNVEWRKSNVCEVRDSLINVTLTLKRALWHSLQTTKY